MTILTPKQQHDLNLSILEYLNANGLLESCEVFKREENLMNSDLEKYEGMLEKRWTCVLRLQKKINELESKVGTQSTLLQKPASSGSLVPKQPELYVVKGHQKSINGIAIHPSCSYFATASDDSTIKVFLI
jgi:platelet-activating factor acetylhydrolase IB subunit alpha